MPYLRVPLTRCLSTRWRRSPSPENVSPSPTISISYRVQGCGPVLVVLVPGMCVPASMYDAMAAVLAATSQFTVVVVDNRGIGRSDAPEAGLLGGIGYTVYELASDAWDVVDTVLQDVHTARMESAIDLGLENLKSGMAPKGENHRWRRGKLLFKEVALVGHSMGGMVVQEMVSQRPRRVRFVALLSTHAGGIWNLMPTTRMLTSVMRVAWSGFDRDVHAAVNLSLHFTQRFLDAWVAPDFHAEEVSNTDGENEMRGGEEKEEEQGEERSCRRENDKEERGHRTNGEVAGCEAECEDGMGESTDLLEVGGEIAGFGYLESKMVELVHDAQVYFGLTNALTDSLWTPQRAIVHAVTKQRTRISRRTRREIYHNKYIGAEPSLPSQRSKLTVSAASSPSMTANPEDSPYVMYGHAAVVRSHTLSTDMARKLRQCTRIVKLVMTGRHDQVVTPSSSRALGATIGANTVVEVEAAHFITDEAAAEVTTHVIYGLRKAFYAPLSALPCECEWCDLRKPEAETQLPTCRMC